MDFLYQIKLVSNQYETYCRPVVAQGIIEKESKKEVIEYIEKEYPEYFDGNRVAQKLSKRMEQIVYVSIHQLDGYWKDYWTSEVECMVCHKKISLLQAKQHLGQVNVNRYTCSIECEKERKKIEEHEINEYWNDRCDYYYIYKISNKTNNKVYVGYTEREPIFRWWEHFKHSHLPIGLALKEEGIENFTFEVLERCHKKEKTVEEMHEIETEYIRQYDSINNGYNCMVSKV